jgi:putative heme-binding domain-containing protein
LAWAEAFLQVDKLTNLLDPSQPAEVQVAVMQLLVGTNRAAEDKVLPLWKKLSPKVREAAGDAIVASRGGRKAIEEALARGDLQRGDLTEKQFQAVLAGNRNLAKEVRVLYEERAKVIHDYAESLKLSGDKARGEEHFKKHCSACHKLGGVGHEIGPNLAAMKARGAEAILTNVLDPNREVNPQFVTYSLVTKEGRVLTGMISAETANSITLKQAENKEETVLRIDIEELNSTGLSLMPEGLEKNLDKQQLADVIEYLMKQ